MNKLIIPIIIFVIIAVGIGGYFVLQKPAFPNPSNEQNIVSAIDSVFQLKINQTAIIQSENLKVKFLDVVEDSRCPSGVQCVWAGQVTIALDITKDGKNLTNFNLVNGVEDQKLAEKNFDGYSVKLIKVEPYPKANQKLKKSDYIATFVISKAG